jgi:flavodoxin I
MMTATIGVFYGRTEGAGAIEAELIKSLIENTGLATVDLYDVAHTDLEKMTEYQFLILGVSTWNIGQLQDDWAFKFSDLDQLDLTGKMVALYGMGDQYGYPDSYVDAIEILAMQVLDCGAEIAGMSLVDESYEFEYSRAVIDGVFMGLALDDGNQGDLTQERTEVWIAGLLEEFGLAVPVPVAIPVPA